MRFLRDNVASLLLLPLALGSLVGAGLLLYLNVDGATRSDGLTFAGFTIAFFLFLVTLIFNHIQLRDIKGQSIGHHYALAEQTRQATHELTLDLLRLRRQGRVLQGLHRVAAMRDTSESTQGSST